VGRSGELGGEGGRGRVLVRGGSRVGLRSGECHSFLGNGSMSIAKFKVMKARDFSKGGYLVAVGKRKFIQQSSLKKRKNVHSSPRKGIFSKQVRLCSRHIPPKIIGS